MRAAEPNDGEIAFIPYISHEDKRRSKQRELLQSDARKHAAAVSHRKRRTSSQTHNTSAVGARRQHSHELYLQPRPNEEGITYTRSSSDTDDHLSKQEVDSDSALWQHQSPQDVSLTSPPSRPLDWHFGSVGLSCRPLGDIDQAALQYFLRQVALQGPAISLGKTMTGVTREKSSSPIQVLSTDIKIDGVLTVSQEVAARAVHQLPLLESLVAYTTFNMYATYPQSGALAAHRQKAAYSALQSIRRAIASPDAIDNINLAHAVQFMSQIAINSGQPAVALIHLQYLREVVRSRQPSSAYEYGLFQQIRAIDTRMALQSGGRPITRGLWESAQVPPESFFDKPGRKMCEPPCRFETIHSIHSKSSWSDQSSPRIGSGHLPPHNWQNGFHTAIENGSINPNLRHVVDHYSDAIVFLSDLALVKAVSRPEKFLARWKCYESLELLCMTWHALVARQAMMNKPGNRSDTTSDEPVTLDERWLDKMVIIALELHLLLVSLPQILSLSD